MTKKYQIINKRNSTVCGYPGRDFDWSKFDWEQKTTHDFGDMRYSTESEFIKPSLRGELIGIKKAPAVYVDDGLIALDCQYLHVPYNWNEEATIYRVRPNHSMYARQMYRGRQIIKQTAVKRKGVWYWVLEYEKDI